MAQLKNDKILNIIIVALSVVGLLYFGISTIRNDHRKSLENPFKYDIENYKESGSDLVSYDEVQTLPVPLDAPHAITVDSIDRVFVTSGNQIVVLDASGQNITTGAASENINAIAVDSIGAIYLALEKSVEILDSTFSRIAHWPIPGERSFLTSIAISQNDLYCADAGERIIWRYNKSGDLQNKIGERDDSKDVPGLVIPSPYFDVLIDTDGFLWAVNTGRHQFENYLPDGTLRSSWQKTSMRIDGFSGCCNPVHIASLPDGSFVTSEKGLLRIKIHNRIGELVEVVALPDQFENNTSDLDIAVNSKSQILVLDPSRKQVRVFQKKDKPS